ncbi:hypothetical protein DUNSADRAFT_17819, partial [Dunaliella salina]
RACQNSSGDSIKVSANGSVHMANGSHDTNAPKTSSSKGSRGSKGSHGSKVERNRGTSQNGQPPLIYTGPQGDSEEEEVGSKVPISINAKGQIVLDENSMNLKKIAEDQVRGNGIGKKEDPYVLVRREVEGLVKPTNDDTLKLECVLGKGAWGTVYKGTWKGLTVAVKTVREVWKIQANQERMARMNMEASERALLHFSPSAYLLACQICITR